MEKLFVRFANATARIAGKPWTFMACLGVVLVWALSGPIFKFSETWQLVINTGTTIITFLMVFLIQNTQNRDGAAMQAKLDELLFAVKQADDRFIGIEHLTEKELDGILSEVERRGEAVRVGKPAQSMPGKRPRTVKAKAGASKSAPSRRTAKARS